MGRGQNGSANQVGSTIAPRSGEIRPVSQPDIGVGTMDSLGVWSRDDFQLNLWDTGIREFGKAQVAYVLSHPRSSEPDNRILVGWDYAPPESDLENRGALAEGLLGELTSTLDSLDEAEDEEEWFASFGTQGPGSSLDQLRFWSEFLVDKRDELKSWADEIG